MISPKKLIKMARKWQKMAAIRRKRISSSRANGDVNNTSRAGSISSRSNSSPVADKGHFVVYTADQRRFVFPITYLNNEIFKELLKLSEEEFGLPSDGPITLPCDAIFYRLCGHFIPKTSSRRCAAESSGYFNSK